ncbi:PREDICTED: E3 ubiquitin-protein ligase TRIM56-like [Nicrophorus vespilloides]|uniref:E3 ubiquitin-protein ligase TRIM56-like n=1 Tax=Nicrophorus vespilloides TaxID=110193 RepID=A0ABM1N2I2_NICVS|nr:PREDICTED: E3 ubiquitin-protein ligase TRIM56-like [Nicrophorus vespilloides]
MASSTGRSKGVCVNYKQQGKSRMFSKSCQKRDPMVRTQTCYNCHREFDLSSRPPIILSSCIHTVCQQCIRETGDKIECNQCHQWSDVKSTKINYYLVGQMYFTKSHQLSDMSNIAFLPAGASIQTFNPQKESNSKNVFNRCSYMKCKNEATLKCNDCSNKYCRNCSEMMHQTTSFKHHIITKDSLNICQQHPGFVEEFCCSDCLTFHCSYCIISNHNGHKIRQINKLDKEDRPRLQDLLNKLNRRLDKMMESHKID